MPYRDVEKQRLSVRKHYQSHKQYYIDKARRLDEKYRAIKREFIVEYLKNHPCVDCGEADIVVLDFDHVKDKVLDISHMMQQKWSLKKIQIEIIKCEVRCANCHRRKTAKDRGYYKYNV